MFGVDDATAGQDLVGQPIPWAGEPLRSALEAGGVGTWSWDRSTGIVVWDPVMMDLFDVDPDEFDGSFDAWLDAVHPGDRADALRTVEEAVETRGSYVVEHRVLWRDGSVHWLQGRGQVVEDDDGEVVGTTGCTWEVTAQVAIASEREQAIAELERSAERDRVAQERLRFLATINEALSTSDSEADIVRNAAFAAVPRLGDWCALAVLPEDGEIPVIEVAHADPEMVAYARDLQQRFPYDPEGRSGMPKVIRSGSSEFIPTIDDEVLAALDTTDEARTVARELQLRSSIIVPLKKRRKVLGALQFINSSHHRVYTGDDLVLAEAVASRIAASLENRRLTERLRRDQFRSALDAMLDNVAITRAIRDDEGEIVDFAIVFMNAASRDGASRGAQELAGATVLDAYPRLLESGLFEQYVRVVEDRAPLVLDRVRYEDATSDGEPIAGWWSMRVVPFDDGYLVSSRDETATVLAERELEQKREAEARNRIALDVLQAAAVPSEVPSVDVLDFGVRYEPAAPGLPVGGDWFDIFEIPDSNAIGVVVADVAGHGPESAAVMVQVRNTMRAYAMEGHAPDEVLRNTNRTLCSGGDRRSFVTCIYVLFDPDAPSARWSCAGHFPPMLARSGTVTILESTAGKPLGVDRLASYRTGETDLGGGDEILLFTDGLVERRGEHIDEGLDRLAGLISSSQEAGAQALVDGLVDQLIADGQRGDDIAIVGIHVTGPTTSRPPPRAGGRRRSSRTEPARTLR